MARCIPFIVLRIPHSFPTLCWTAQLASSFEFPLTASTWTSEAQGTYQEGGVEGAPRAARTLGLPSTGNQGRNCRDGGIKMPKAT